MQLSRRIMLALLCGAAAGAALPLAWRAGADGAGTADASEPLPVDALRSFVQALDLIGSRYVEPVPTAKLMENALRGMVDGLEPHSHYLDKDEYAELNINTTGKYGGVGLETEQRGGFLRVVAATDHTPAAAAGIQPGDIITFIDGVTTSGMSMKDSVERMRGMPGTRVKVSLMRPGQAKAIVLTLTREEIKVPSVHAMLLEPGIGYLRVSHFAQDTGEAATDELDKLKQRAGGELHGLILDLRSNPGGVVGAAVTLSDDFLERGRIVTQRGRVPEANHNYDAGPGDLLDGHPLVAMVDGGTASAAEIVAGALQDHHRAVLVGQTTFGKGLVQNITPLQGGGALVLTIARYYTPSGRSIQAEGITPDIALDEVRLSPLDAAALPHEADLKGALAHEGGTRLVTPAGVADLKPDELARMVQSDTALYNSINVLKGMISAASASTG